MSFHPKMEYAPARFHKSARRLAETGEPFTFTPENQATFDEIVTHYPPERRKSAILYALYLAQRQQGYLTAAAMRHVADQLGCTAAEVEDVVSYYTMFYTRPVGKYVLNVFRTLSCALLGAERGTLRSRIESRLLAASLPLCILVFAGSAIVVVRGVREAVALWHRRARSGDWVFPLMVVALFVVVPNLVNGGETNRMRYSIEPVLVLALAGGFLQLLRRYGKRLARLFADPHDGPG